MHSVHLKSYCKVNLTLRVIKKLKTGLHDIRSFIALCEPHDDLYISNNIQKKDLIIFLGKFKKKISTKNTISNTLALLRKRGIVTKRFYRIKIYKNIPHGAGLGGGSSNAAVLLDYLIKKSNYRLQKNTILNLAEKIGSDVPIILSQLRNLKYKNQNFIYLKKKNQLHLLLAFPKINLSTKKVYHENKNFSKNRKYFNLKLNGTTNVIKYLKQERNDLQNIVIKKKPIITRILKDISKIEGCHFSRMTGSGSTCIGVFSSKKTCNLGKKLIKKKFPKIWIAASKTI